MFFKRLKYIYNISSSYLSNTISAQPMQSVWQRSWCWDRWEPPPPPPPCPPSCPHTDPHYPESSGSSGSSLTLTLQLPPRDNTWKYGGQREQEGGGKGGGVGGEQAGGGGRVGGDHLLQPARLAGSSHGYRTACHQQSNFLNWATKEKSGLLLNFAKL